MSWLFQGKECASNERTTKGSTGCIDYTGWNFEA